MDYQTVFKRYEMKYMISREQKEKLLEVMQEYMKLDQFGHSLIRNIYYDIDSYQLIRHSIEKTFYKEKLRVRSYGSSGNDSTVFVELKKKYDSVVYKRRIGLEKQDAILWLDNKIECPKQTQISKEIDYFKDFYKTLHPVVFLSYEREAYYSLCGDDFRITFDENIKCREDELFIDSDIFGIPVLDKDTILLEIKTSGAIPLWMTKFLTINKIYRTSFSKYGSVYQNIILKRELGGRAYA